MKTTIALMLVATLAACAAGHPSNACTRPTGVHHVSFESIEDGCHIGPHSGDIDLTFNDAVHEADGIRQEQSFHQDTCTVVLEGSTSDESWSLILDVDDVGQIDGEYTLERPDCTTTMKVTSAD